METMGLLVDEQNGFRPGRSCIDHAFTLSSIIRNRINQKKSTFVAYVDFEKAFDWVDRDLLFYKLLTYNVDGRFYNSIKALYANTTTCIKLNGNLTDWFATKTGVRQGDVMSPTLFNIYINDLAKSLKDLNCGVDINGIIVSILLYADDIVLLAESEADLQRMLTHLYSWCKKWKMKVNNGKTKVVHYRHSRAQRTSVSFNMGPDDIEIVHSYKYLVFFFDEHLNFKEGIETLSKAAGRALRSIISKFRSTTGDMGLGWMSWGGCHQSIEDI